MAYLPRGLCRRLLGLERLPGLGKLRLPKLPRLLLEGLLLLLLLLLLGCPLPWLLCCGASRERPRLWVRHRLRLSSHPRIMACQMHSLPRSTGPACIIRQGTLRLLPW